MTRLVSPFGDAKLISIMDGNDPPTISGHQKEHTVSVPQNKAELLAAIEKNYVRLAADLALVGPGRTDDKTMPGHAKDSMMSVHDLVAYLVGWNRLVLKWHLLSQSGQPVDFPETGYKWNELGRLAQKFYADYQHLSFVDLLAEFARAKSDLVAVITSEDDASLYGRPWYERWTLGRMIQFNSASPYANASARLRKWRKLTART